ncbi:lipopolysaccharide biosynthesis protein [Ornithinimicrobium sp. CNJ-824]|uniref:lipopolysaccharide biosynthesis protein n=1 Tax=Ornithinimicrobium sp. CNJ-824 TaxID=1904966 RepID=UPI001EDACA18|nr:hypothetical protein [Ornithinimicrobium sp. CNJ-824]
MLLPFVAAKASPEEFAHVVLVITVSAVISNLVGGESANTLLIRGHAYAEEGRRWDFHKVFLWATLGGLLISSGIWTLIAGKPSTVLGAGTLMLMTALRLFLASPFRLQQRFGVVTTAHLVYVLGSLSALPATVRGAPLLTPFLVGEAVSVLFLCAVLLRQRRRGTPEKWGTAHPFVGSLKTYVALATAAALANVVGYMDRLFITPLLGASALAVYFAASVIPKSLGVVTNPLVGLLLARFGSSSDEDAPDILRSLLKLVPAAAIIGTVLALGAGWLGLSLLYPQFEQEGREVIPPISLSVGIATGAYLLQPFILRFRPSRYIIFANAIQAIIFVVSALVLSRQFGVVGFAWASAITHLGLLLVFLSIVHERRATNSS